MQGTASMNKAKSTDEFLVIGGAFVLAPIVAGGVSIPLYNLTQNASVVVMISSIIGMGIYIGACMYYSKAQNQSLNTNVANCEIDAKFQA